MSSSESKESNLKVHNKWEATMEAVNTGLSATFAGVMTEIIFYGLDSYKVVQQAGEKIKFSKLFRGSIPIALTGAAPSYGVFFVLYNPIRNVLNDQLGPGKESVSVLLSSIIAGIPSSVVYVPADVVKKQILLGTVGKGADGKSHSVLQTARHLAQTEGIGRLFLGWKANLYKDVAFSAIKMSLYEGLARAYLDFKIKDVEEKSDKVVDADSLSSLEAAGVGFVSGVCTAIATCPIDCVNSRIKSGELANFDVMHAHLEIIRKDGMSALFRGVVARSIMLGLGSTVFWYLQASSMHLLTGSADGGGHGH